MKRRGGDEEEREGGENERMRRRGGVLDDAGSRNSGRRPRVPASKDKPNKNIGSSTYFSGLFLFIG